MRFHDTVRSPEELWLWIAYYHAAGRSSALELRLAILLKRLDIALGARLAPVHRWLPAGWRRAWIRRRTSSRRLASPIWPFIRLVESRWHKVRRPGWWALFEE